ncbi:hypothetical protein F4V91_05460 [Neorhizobium galegae]|uniref:Propionyl-coenzyme A carboxylase alpha polypeptide n=1 Tax=Neorhizobium galegae TaxID=399 RepID=A0A6A1TNV1_NEOGA|nr:hypothetical protein F4V91_05460 [Neorhizobium galegae]
MGAPPSPNNKRCCQSHQEFGGKSMPLVISPPVGEMPGRAEGGDLARRLISASGEAHLTRCWPEPKPCAPSSRRPCRAGGWDSRR